MAAPRLPVHTLFLVCATSARAGQAFPAWVAIVLRGHSEEAKQMLTQPLILVARGWESIFTKAIDHGGTDGKH